MKINWLKNPDNVVYADISEFADYFGRELGVDNLKQEIIDFFHNPVKEGKTLKGVKRSSAKLFIPDMVFDEHIEMGEKVWLYLGESYESYCIYGYENL